MANAAIAFIPHNSYYDKNQRAGLTWQSTINKKMANFAESMLPREHIVRIQAYQKCNDEYQTLLHCDLKIENILLDNSKVTMVDMQCLGFGNPVFDVTQFIGYVMSAKDREFEQQLQQAYLNKFCELKPQFTQILTLEKFQQDYKAIMMLHVFFYASLMFQWDTSKNAELEAHLGRYLLIILFVVDGILASVV